MRDGECVNHVRAVPASSPHVLSHTSAISDEDPAEHRHLQLRRRSAAFDEVGQDGGEEHDHFGVGDADDESVAQQLGGP